MEEDLCCIMPAMAAAGPVAAVPTGLDACFDSISLSEVSGDNAGCDDFCSALRVISI